MSFTPENLTDNKLITLFYIPSFYGALTWGIWLLLYPMNLVKVDDAVDMASFIYISTEILFVLSTLVTFPHYNKIINERVNVSNAISIATEQSSTLKLFILFLHLIGFIGLIKWFTHLAGYMGGLNLVWHALLNEAEKIRGNTELPTTVGIQLTYFGWIGIGITAYAMARKQLSKWWLVLALIQLGGNFLYIGRTQPIWIMFTSFLMVLAAFVKVSFKKTVICLLSVIFSFLLIFWAVAEWSGKTYYEGILEDPRIPGITQVIYAYGVSGFAYFNYMLVNNEPIAFKPERVLYPPLKLLAKFGLVDEPPTQILEFYGVPFETNVGSFLEPFYRDGGMLFVFFGILIYSFGLDLLGLIFLQSGKPVALYAWSNLCFTTMIAFLTPKIVQFPIWLFVGLGLISILSRTLHANIIEGKPST